MSSRFGIFFNLYFNITQEQEYGGSVRFHICAINNPLIDVFLIFIVI